MRCAELTKNTKYAKLCAFDETRRDILLCMPYYRDRDRRNPTDTFVLRAARNDHASRFLAGTMIDRRLQ